MTTRIAASLPEATRKMRSRTAVTGIVTLACAKN